MKGQTSLVKKFKLIFFGFFLSFVILESSLQILSLFTSEKPMRLTVVSDSQTTLLCLGESTTAWGGNDSYPEQLQREIQVHFPNKKIKIVNGGVPGISSQEILNSLDENINKYHPRFVLLMMGVNDFWSNKNLIPNHGIKFLWKIGETFRSVKLLYLLWANLNYKSPPHFVAKEKIPPLSRPWPDLIRNKLQLEDTQLAFELAKQYTIESPYPSSYFQAGIIFEEKYQQQERQNELIEMAKYFYQEATKLEPHPTGNSGASLHLAIILERENKLEQAQHYFEMATQSGVWSHTPRALYYFANFFEKQKNWDMAIKYYEKAGQIKGQGMEVYWNWKSYQALVRIWSTKGNLEKAKTFLLAAKRDYPNNPFLDQMSKSPQALFQELKENKNDQDFESGPKSFYQTPIVQQNYRYIIEKLWKKNITPVVVSYPKRSLSSLKQIFNSEEKNKIIWIENSKLFDEELKNSSYEDLFVDRFAGDFGHASPRGNRLLSQNIFKHLEQFL